ncbi:NADPH:quinone reductase [Actinomadura sp. NBRC 104412]|uniref:zinc-binding dehydrogenase n=1 Tax=Actinomadura sp. NBRC 104412 TaxID=3032203 RepID=UPI0024A00C36|nr:zinc-binding dehydrogenase [Actinomadura sp. NBRC 104412]GLZ02575.1 NADPH:quinone reductase [Actinomadura sp. NBRC 104412]
MRGVWLREFGGPEVLRPGDVPEPSPRAGEVVIGVEAIGIPFIETQVRSGSAPVPLPELPVVPGNGVGGTVVALGPGGDPALLGTRVVASTGGSGGYAERVAVAEDALIPVPAELETAQAVALLADGRTAMALIRAAAPQAGERVLVQAAGGGVGGLLVQLAASAGAEVVALAGSRRKLDLATELGAAVAVNYREPDWADRVRKIADGGVHIVFDGVGGEIGRASFDLLAPRGRFVMFGAASGAPTDASVREVFERAVALVTGAQLFTSPADVRAMATAALAEAAAGRLRPIIGQTFPLERAADAHRAIESRDTVGKTLLIP